MWPTWPIRSWNWFAACPCNRKLGHMMMSMHKTLLILLKYQQSWTVSCLTVCISGCKMKHGLQRQLPAAARFFTSLCWSEYSCAATYATCLSAVNNPTDGTFHTPMTYIPLSITERAHQSCLDVTPLFTGWTQLLVLFFFCHHKNLLHREQIRWESMKILKSQQSS